MINHTKKFYIKQKEREIQKKLRLEEKRMLKESAYKRRLKRSREKYKAMKNANGAEYQSYLENRRIYGEKYRIYRKKHPEKYKIYYEKCKLKIAKDREERLIAFLGERNWRKIKIEGQKCSHYVVDDGHVYKETGKEIGSVNKNGYVQTSFGYIHKIIWEAFKGKIPEGYELDHINTVRTDNRLENLRLVSHKENCNNPISIEHFKQSNKTKAIFKYHNIIQMDLENNVIAIYNTTEDIPSKYSKNPIYSAIKGRLKTAYGYIWKANA